MVTNIAGTKTSKHLGPAIFTRDGEVAQDEMKATIIVPITPDSLEGRASAFGGNPGEVFIERAGAGLERRAWTSARRLGGSSPF